MINHLYIIIGISFGILLFLYIFYKKFHRIKYSVVSLFEMPEKDKAELRETRIEHYEDNQLVKFHCEYVKDVKDGKETLFYPTGEVNRIRHWKSGKLHGEMTVFYQNGVPYIIGQYYYGKPIGTFLIYKQDGQVLKSIKY